MEFFENFFFIFWDWLTWFETIAYFHFRRNFLDLIHIEKKNLISRPSRRVQKWWTIDFKSLKPYLWFEIFHISGLLRPKKLLARKVTNKTVKRGNFFFQFAFPKSNFFLWKSCQNSKSFCHINHMTSNYILRGKSLNSVKIDLTPRAYCEKGENESRNFSDFLLLISKQNSIQRRDKFSKNFPHYFRY